MPEVADQFYISAWAFKACLLDFLFRASGEAILGTQRYFSKDALFPTSLLCGFSNSRLRTQGGLQVIYAISLEILLGYLDKVLG